MDFQESLVEAVRSYPCLWMTTCKGYRDIKARENAWKVVAAQVHVQMYFVAKQTVDTL